jgi:predicted molibdopterin-dependent oxidoreductase YjgC
LSDTTHLEDFRDQIVEALLEEHSNDCWPNSDCRTAGECTYGEEMDESEIEEYLYEHAEDFEVELDEEDAILPMACAPTINVLGVPLDTFTKD